MLVIKGNLIIRNDKLRTGSLLRQAQNRISSETSSEQITEQYIVAFADISKYDITEATILYGDTVVDYIDTISTVLVTGEVVYEL